MSLSRLFGSGRLGEDSYLRTVEPSSRHAFSGGRPSSCIWGAVWSRWGRDVRLSLGRESCIKTNT